jgi:hypothetical protein
MAVYYRILPGANSAYQDMVAGFELKSVLAARGFQILGQDARSAIPELAELAHARNKRSALVAISALQYLGQDALEPLLAIATNTTFEKERRFWAMTTLGKMSYLGTNATPAVPLLIQCLREPDLAADAANALGSLGLKNDASVHALIQCAQVGTNFARFAAIRTLGTFGEQARAAVPALLRFLDEPDVDLHTQGSESWWPRLPLHESVTNALLKISPEALTNHAPK